jgi:hypothetical protein
MTVSKSDAPPPEIYDPLALGNLQTMLREELEARPRAEFPPDPFRGAGLYALYYVGELGIYAPLVETDREVPVYVGKAEAGNSSYGEPTDENGFQLFDRVVKHSISVEEATINLKTDDFCVRYLPLDDAWIVLGERALLRAYRPVLWNTLMPGFGANPPGTARRNARSIWDTVHPGRLRAGGLCNRRFTLGEMHERIAMGVRIALMDEGPERDKAVKELKAFRRPQIWKPAKRSSDQIIVGDEPRFLAEMERLGEQPPEYVLAGADQADQEADPEEVAELNTRAAEDAEES